MSADTDAFRALYDPDGDLSFAGIRFRDGAPFSQSPDRTPCGFGLSEGFRTGASGMEWGWVRFHLGVDRAPVPRIVRAPFAFDEIWLHDDGGLVYGSLLCGRCHRWGFEVRIAHADPRCDIRPEILSACRDHAPVAAGTELGAPGYYGIGAGAHTHTEIVSLGDSAPLLDELLRLRWGHAMEVEYSLAEVVGEYRRHSHFASADDEVIWRDYEVQRSDYGIAWCNRFRALMWDRLSGQMVTRYSSDLVFNGM